MERHLVRLVVAAAWCCIAGALPLWGAAPQGCVKGDCVNGRGTFVLPDGSKYVGTFKAGVPEGRGSFFFKDGRVYTGDYRGGRRTGKGKFTCPVSQR